MKNTSTLENISDEFDVVVIGAGIVGAGIFRDLSLHGVKTLLIDKKDFCSQTSSSSSKMLHGGIRYLENLDFNLVFEALHEKNLWLKLAPHLCYEEPFYMPIYKDSLRPMWMLKCGLFLYDLLSSFENSPHHMDSKEKVLQKIPGIKKRDLRGAGVYYDAVMDDTKLGLEVIFDGLQESQSRALNYVELLKYQTGTENRELLLRDTITKVERSIKSKFVIFATGPFTDQFFSKLKPFPWKPKLLPSKGSHLWIKKESLPLKHPMVLTPKDGRVIFVIPQKDKVLVGTTEVETSEDYFDMAPSQKEIKYLLDNLFEYFPDRHLTDSDIISAFAGIRPLVQEDESSSRGKTAREHKVFQPYGHTFVILGGKYTTFRVMGQEISENICGKLGISFSRNSSKRPLRVASQFNPFSPHKIDREELFKIIENEKPRTLQDLLHRRLDLPQNDLTTIPEDLLHLLKENKDLLLKDLSLTEEEKSLL